MKKFKKMLFFIAMSISFVSSCSFVSAMEVESSAPQSPPNPNKTKEENILQNTEQKENVISNPQQNINDPKQKKVTTKESEENVEGKTGGNLITKTNRNALFNIEVIKQEKEEKFHFYTLNYDKDIPDKDIPDNEKKVFLDYNLHDKEQNKSFQKLNIDVYGDEEITKFYQAFDIFVKDNKKDKITIFLNAKDDVNRYNDVIKNVNGLRESINKNSTNENKTEANEEEIKEEIKID